MTIAPARPATPPVTMGEAETSMWLSLRGLVGAGKAPRPGPVPAPAWDRAACQRAVDVDWFAGVRDDGGEMMISRARAVCEGCPIQTQCLTWALRHESAGVWGGLTESERFACGGVQIPARSRSFPWTERIDTVRQALAKGISARVVNDAIVGVFGPAAR